MGVYYIEASVWELKSMGITNDEGDIRQPAFVANTPRLLQDLVVGFEGYYVAFWNESSEVGGDRTRAAADVEDPHSGFETREEVGA